MRRDLCRVSDPLFRHEHPVTPRTCRHGLDATWGCSFMIEVLLFRFDIGHQPIPRPVRPHASVVANNPVWARVP